MPTLSIKNVPQRVVARLRRRARINHRSLQGELLSIVEGATGGGGLSVAQVRRAVKRFGPPIPGDSVRLIREDRDAR